MTLPEDRIKQAILHAEEEMRLTALDYFAGSASEDRTVMPLVIQAVEQYGIDTAFRILRGSDRLSQTAETIDWLISQLRQHQHPENLDDDNHRFAIALIILEADPELFIKRHGEITALFPDELKAALDDRLKMHFWNWPTTWAAFEQLGRDSMEMDTVTRSDMRCARRILKALTRHNNRHDDQVLDVLRRQYKRDVRPLMEWLEPWIVELAGRMRLEKAIPLLIRRLDEGYESVIDAIGPALSRIGTNSVIQAVNHAWRQADTETRFVLCEPLEDIHTDLSIERSLTFLSEEDDLDMAVHLGYAALSHFVHEAIEPVRQLVLGDDDELDPEQWELRHRLVATCVIMNESFPEFEQWHEDAVASNWGWGEYEPERLSDGFRDNNDETDKDDGVTDRTIHITPELKELLEAQRQAYIEKHGREPDPDEPIFPDLPHGEHLEHMLVEDMQKAGIDPAIIFAYEQTGLLVTEGHEDAFSEEDLAAWDAAIEEYEAQHERIEVTSDRKQGSTYQLKITLKDIQPPVWRRIVVKDYPLSNLHEVIQVAMGWENCHLYEFQIDDERYGDLSTADRDPDMLDARRTKLSQVTSHVGSRFRYVYDFGDWWDHEIVVERILSAKKGQPVTCLEGQRACPPEDVGGVPGYEEFLKIIHDRDHKEHDQMLEWAGESLDPEVFDIKAVNRMFKSVR